MKIFISQPMRGKTDEQMKEERDEVILKLNRRYNGDKEEMYFDAYKKWENYKVER